METLQELLKDQASFLSHNPPPADDPEESQHGCYCISLEDFMYQTDCDELIIPSFSLGHYYFEAARNAGFNKIINKNKVLKNGANGLFLFGNWLEEEESKEASQNGALGHSFVHEQDHLNVAKGHSYFNDHQFVGNGHSLFVDGRLWLDRKEPEEQQ
ncbi:hypothetical protein V6N13_140483 [Hibiscus sabdariffa]|uniref:Uncharacterized protein n=1 Tax=Hibiscus sabdariffa TaxID=183260 RepID=A0ABR2BKQ1_9ROSI